MGYNNPWPYIRAKQSANEAESRAYQLQRQLEECHQELERTRKEKMLLQEELEKLKNERTP